MASEKYKEFASQLKTYMADRLGEDGYRLVDEVNLTYESRHSDYTDFITLYTGEDERQKRYSSMIECFRRIEILENYWETYKQTPLKIQGLTPYTLVANAYERDKATFAQKNVTRVEIPYEAYSISQIGEGHIGYWKNRFKPWLDRFSNIMTLNSEINRTVENLKGPINNNGAWFYKMIIAKLAGSPIYEQIYNTYKSKLEKALEQEAGTETIRDYLWVTEQLHAKLEEVKPLENPGLI
ncbi:MAG TPA: hypothetical protein VIM75_17325 [Ohtaekwangia sp.]|uniref:hypothetical protein n=1 Tax=Ohtaekwangia sp. TaxID=2066019 RepID=UPI002F92DCFC